MTFPSTNVTCNRMSTVLLFLLPFWLFLNGRFAFVNAEDGIVTLTPSQGLQIDECTLQNAEGVINLKPIGNAEASPRWKNHTAYNTTFDPGLYSYDPCYAFNQGACKNSLVCRSDENYENDISIGKQGTGRFFYDDLARTYMVQYTAGEGENQMTTNVILQCATMVQDTLEIIGNLSNNVFLMTLTSRCCCPGLCPPEIGPGDNSGLSFGSIVCIMFVCITFSYFILGMVYMKAARGASGAEIIPHLSFWMDLPNLIMDGVTYVCTCGKSTISTPEGPGTGPKSTYESI